MLEICSTLRLRGEKPITALFHASRMLNGSEAIKVLLRYCGNLKVENERLKGLSLFSGVAGLELGLTEWVKTEQYVEIDKYAQAVLRSRMEAGDIDTAHIHDDIKTFKAEKGRFDIITGGFPCVDISNAGKREGIHAERSGLWFEMQRLVSELRPRYLFVENVSAILGRGLDEVLGSLSEIGYDAVWTTLRASDVGAPHRRERWFMLAYPSSGQSREQTKQEGRKDIGGGSQEERAFSNTDQFGRNICNSPQREHEYILSQVGQPSQDKQSGGGWKCGLEQICENNVPNPLKERCGRGQTRCRTDGERTLEKDKQDNRDSVRSETEGCNRNRGRKENVPDCNSEGLERLNSKEAGTGQPKTSVRLRGRDVWRQDPADLDPSSLTDLGRMAYGTSSPLDGSKWGYTPRVYRNSKNSFRIKRLKCLGNAVVPQQAREAFIRLMQIKEELKK